MPPAAHTLRVLLLEDSILDAELTARELKDGHFEFLLERAETRAEFSRAIEQFQPDIILSDYRLPGFDGGLALEIAQHSCPDVPLIIISGTLGEEAAVELLKNGATDFVLKDRLKRLCPAVHRALREVAERNARRQAEQDLRLLNAELEARVAERTRELREKNTLIDEDLDMASDLQRALLPQQFPTIPRGVAPAESALKFASIYRPAGSVSGDFFNVSRISDSAVGLFVCDVMGHGVRAALVTAMLRTLEEQLITSAHDPGTLLTEINRAMRGILRHASRGFFTTACHIVVDLENSCITAANAGHPSPLLVRPGSREVQPITTRAKSGPALGLYEHSQYPTSHLPLEANDLILCFTDGLFEVENPLEEPFTESRLHDSIRQRAHNPLPTLVQQIFEEAQRFASPQPFSDDVCLVGMQITRLFQTSRAFSPIPSLQNA